MREMDTYEFKLYIIKQTPALQKFYPTFILIFLFIYLLSIGEAYFYFPINTIEVFPKRSDAPQNRPYDIKIFKWLKNTITSPPIMLVTHFITTQWKFGIEKPWHGKVMTWAFLNFL